MATSFINAVARQVGTQAVVVYTVPAQTKAILIGCNLANITGGIVPVNLVLRKASGDSFIVKAMRVGNGENAEVMRGNKLVMQAGDALVATSALDGSLDVIASILTGVT
jgi:hypothetical protein